jgi:hypothetical protein
MNTTINAISALVLILESPDSKKGYAELKRFYDQSNMIEESEAISHLISKKFDNATSNSHTDIQ